MNKKLTTEQVKAMMELDGSIERARRSSQRKRSIYFAIAGLICLLIGIITMAEAYSSPDEANIYILAVLLIVLGSVSSIVGLIGWSKNRG